MSSTPNDPIPVGLTNAYNGLPLSTELMLPVERHMLACLFRDPEQEFDRAATVLTHESFAWAHHRSVFRAMLTVRAAGRPVKLHEVYRQMVADRTVRDLGPDPAACHDWFADTYDLEPTGAMAGQYTADLLEHARRRKLCALYAELSSEVMDMTRPISDLIGENERGLAEVTAEPSAAGQILDMPTMIRRTQDAIDERARAGGKLRGLATGHVAVDRLLGGLRGGQLVVVGARPGGGKTAIGLNVAARLMADGVPVFMASAEMPAEQLLERLIAMRSGVPMSKIVSGRIDDGDVTRIAAATDASGLGRFEFFVDDAGDQSAARVATMLRRCVRRYGVRLGVVDYLQLLRPENPRDNRTQQVGTLARRMKQMARECDVPVICLCQLNREVEGRPDQRPRLSDLRESGEIEAHADVVLLLHTRPNQPEDWQAWDVDVIVAKNRNGPLGTAELTYRRPVLRFEDRVPA